MAGHSSSVQTVDLTRLDSMPRSARSQPTWSSEIVDLTFSDNDQENTPVEDHMHAVVDILRPGAVDLTETETSSRRKRRNMGAADPSHKRRRTHGSHSQAASIETKKKKSSVEPRLRQSPQEKDGTMSLSSASSTRGSMPRRFEPTSRLSTQAKKASNAPFKPFPFMDFPPEIRNSVYRFLLTTPLTPIELPELTGRNGAAHRAQWAKCTTAKMRRKHKTIFLEILETCKQVHDEASGILYGCNVFKYRSNPGARSTRVVLPTRHLQLLKHIKISVMSRGFQRDQDEQVAELVKQFAKDGLALETFEITWWGQDRYHLRADSPMCIALGKLVVERHFIMKVAGEARMERGMKDQLERILLSKGARIVVEIHRPVKDNGEELDDDSGTDVQY
ncbi:hypothetical protein JMJ35_003719 [Cladonia borealis]|uniref:DUF7730 domain-containing protein n=1 Tax=Cladonia borealis TaxID=184061 RepID=A0AA39R311_9LECA|nr:hypothetical protein JMJ35_003719 [Cladonia borealis]